MDDRPARRTPNTGTTAAQWEAIYARFKAGETIAELADAFDLAFTTVALRLQRARIRRADHPRRRAVVVASSEDGGAVSAAAPAAAPALWVPAGADAQGTARALADWSRALTSRGLLKEAAEALRLARLHTLTGNVGAADDDAAAAVEALAPPVLRRSQTPPVGDWRTWLFLGGRGAGKTLAGAAWLAGQAQAVGRLALVGPTLLDVRDVMIEGPSGLRGLGGAFGPSGGRARYEPSRRKLIWPNGATASVFSAEDPDSLRGPQFGAAWADELCAWAHPGATLSNLRLGLRLGEDPRVAHAGGLEALEEQLLLLGAASERGTASPDRADAAVWALTELMGRRGGGAAVATSCTLDVRGRGR